MARPQTMPLSAFAAVALASQAVHDLKSVDAKKSFLTHEAMRKAPTASIGDLVTVHFVVTDQTGKELANSQKRGLAYTFKVPAEPDFWSRCTEGLMPGAERSLALEAGKSYDPAELIPVVPPSSKISIWVKVLSIRHPNKKS